jgi:hypothetical protein
MIDIIEENDLYYPYDVPEIKWASRLKIFVNTRFRFHDIVESFTFNIFVLIITTADCCKK